MPGTRRAWPRPSTATPRSAPRGPAEPRAASGERRVWVGGGTAAAGSAGADRRGPLPAGRCTTRWRSTGTGGSSGGAGGGRAPSTGADHRVVPPPPPPPSGRRRAQLRRCLERLKQQVPVGAGPARSTTLSLLHRARLHIQVRGQPRGCLGPSGWGPKQRAPSGDRSAQPGTTLTAHGIPTEAGGAGAEGTEGQGPAA